MENYFKKVLRVIAKFVVFLLHPYIIKMIKSIINYVTTEYIVKQLNKFGSNPIICFPISTLGLNYIEIGNNFRARPYLRIEAYDKHLSNQYAPKIIIGDNVSIDFNCHIGCINQVRIGNNVLIASKVFITDHYHGKIDIQALCIPPDKREIYSSGPVVIKDNVWIGENVAIMPNVTIGYNAIIGANAVVTKSIPDNCVACGVPAKVIKQL